MRVTLARRVLLSVLLAAALFALAIAFAEPGGAMPEYATQVGEPCATCHVSAAGGGLRNVRGQAWVAKDKPAAAPSTTDSLTALGVQLPADMTIYSAAPAGAPAAAPLARPGPAAWLLDKLLEYEGN